VEFLVTNFDLPSPSTIYRWLGTGYLAELVEKGNGLYRLKGYPGGQIIPTVVIPCGPDDCFRDLYVRLGWEPKSYDDATRTNTMTYPVPKSVLKHELTPLVFPVPDIDLVPEEFRAYRKYVRETGYTRIRGTNYDERSYFADVCAHCPSQAYHAPWLKGLCPQCKSKGSFNLTAEKLQALKVLPDDIHILVYLSYEFRKEMMTIMERAMREYYEKYDYSRFYRCRAALGIRYLELVEELRSVGTYDESAERELGIALFNFATISAVDAETAIRLTLDYCRWHQMNEVARKIAPEIREESAFIEQQRAIAKEYFEVAEPIIHRAISARLP